MDLFDAMAAFVRAAERGGFSAAARDLGVSQPHVTRAVAELEQRLGTRLFNRSTRRVTLTDEGLDYLDRARSILAAIEDADESVGARAETLRGELRVFAPVSLGRAWIVPRLGAFMARHAQLSVKLVLDDRPRDLVAERLDVAVLIGPIADQSLRARKLGRAARIIAASPVYWELAGRLLHPTEIAKHTWLIFDGPVRVDRVRLRRDGELSEHAMPGRFASNSSEALQEAMLCGLGACFAPRWLIADGERAGKLEQALCDWRAEPDLEIFAAYSTTRAPTEKVRRFIDWLAFSLHADGHLEA